MLAIDAGVTIATWLPSIILSALSMTQTLPEAIQVKLKGQVVFLAMGLQTANVFTSPVIYFLANRAFRVSIFYF